MPSLTDLANDALGQIGQSFITAIDDGSTTANLCNRFLSDLRDAVLRDHTWKFARKRVVLAQNAAPPVSGWALAFTLPDDCIRVIRLGLSDDTRWSVEGKNLVTDESSATILYIARITDPSLWDAAFYQALSTRLASKLAMPLAHNGKMAADLFGLYASMIADAKAIDSQEGIQDSMDSVDLTTDSRMF